MSESEVRTIKDWGVDVGVAETKDGRVLHEMNGELGIADACWASGIGMGQEDAQYDFATKDEANEAASRIRAWLLNHDYTIWTPDGDFWDPTEGAVVSVYRNGEPDEDTGTYTDFDVLVIPMSDFMPEVPPTKTDA